VIISAAQPRLGVPQLAAAFREQHRERSESGSKLPHSKARLAPR
jgi:hypothetical protein